MCTVLLGNQKRVREMTTIDHNWITDVFQDLREYLKAHDLDCTHAAMTHALNIAFWEINEDMAQPAKDNTLGCPPYSFIHLKEMDWYNVIILPRHSA